MNGLIAPIADPCTSVEGEHICAILKQERQLIAGEVHDSVAQALAFIKMRLPLIEDAITCHDSTLAQRYLGELRDVVGQAHTDLREIVTHLRVGIDPRGLHRALENLTTQFQQRTGIVMQACNSLPNLELGSRAEAEIYHIVEQALSNIEQHANARHAWLQLMALNSESLHVCIDDDGTGSDCDQDDGLAHHGLEIMKERAQRLGGSLEVLPRNNGGTRVVLIVPNLAQISKRVIQ